MSASSMLTEARRWLGTRGRPNALTQAYSGRNGSAFLRAPWCDISVTEWARRSGNYDAVCPNGDRAYTVWHAQDFQKLGRWHKGTSANVNRARPGDIVFFDWGGADSIGAIDHVGIVEKALGGGRVQCIEANTSDACLRRIRSYTVIAGLGRPAYSGSSSGGSLTKEDPLIGLKVGDKGEAVKGLQEMILLAGFGKHLGASGVDGDYGKATAEALRLVRKSVGSEARAGWGDSVSGAAYKQVHEAAMIAVSKR